MSRNEAKTRKELVDPKLKESGWFENNWQIDPEYKITSGRIHFDGKVARRSKPIYTDYLLRYSPGKPIAVVEAKAEEKHHLEGERQAKDYAKKLGLYFAYSTNGHQIEFFNLKSNTQITVEKFHSPKELWMMYLKELKLEKTTPEKCLALTHDYYDESRIGQRRKLRYYQEKAINNAIESILLGKKRILITMATGTGKTFTAIQLVYKLWKARIVKKVLFMVDRNLLADQAFADFNNAMDKDACYRLSPSDKEFPKGRDLYFGIYQTLVGVDDEDESIIVGKPDRYKEFPKDYFDLIVIDEAHRGARRSRDGKEISSWFKLLEYFQSSIQLGLTATPQRQESNDTYAYFGKPVVTYSLKEGISDGHLAPYIIKRVTSNIDALGYRPERNDIEDVRGKTLEVKDYLTPDFERQLSIPQRSRAFAYHLLRHLFSTDPIGKTIVFCLNQEHALDMAKYCQEAFAHYKKKYQLKDYKGNYAVRITNNDRNNRGKYPDLEKFQDLESYQPVIVTTSKLLTTGIDVKNIKNIVIFKNVGSLVEFKQIIGRGTRTYEHKNKDKEKLGFFILEYANYSTQLFNDPEWDDQPEGFIKDEPVIIDDIDDEESKFKLAEKKLDKNEYPINIFEPLDDDTDQKIRYRMSEEFLSGRVVMAAESMSLTGPDGKPISQEGFLTFQSTILKDHIKTTRELKEIWKDNIKRGEFRENASSIGLNIDALISIFFEKHGIRNVDMLDVFLSLCFNEKYLTKEERIEKAKNLKPKVFNLGSQEKNNILTDVLEIYKDAEYRPLEFKSEFWQIPQIKKHGGFQGVKEALGGKEKTFEFVNNLQQAIYDENITA